MKLKYVSKNHIRGAILIASCLLDDLPWGEKGQDGKLVRFFNLQPCPLLHRTVVNPITKYTQGRKSEGESGEQERERVRYNIVSMREIKEPVHWQGRAILAHCV